MKFASYFPRSRPLTAAFIILTASSAALSYNPTTVRYDRLCLEVYWITHLIPRRERDTIVVIYRSPIYKTFNDYATYSLAGTASRARKRAITGAPNASLVVHSQSAVLHVHQRHRRKTIFCSPPQSLALGCSLSASDAHQQQAGNRRKLRQRLLGWKLKASWSVITAAWRPWNPKSPITLSLSWLITIAR